MGSRPFGSRYRQLQAIPSQRRLMPAFDVPMTLSGDYTPSVDTQGMLDVPNTEATPSVYVPPGAAAGGIAFLAITFFVGCFFWRKRKPVEIADPDDSTHNKRNAEDELLLMSLSYKSLPEVVIMRQASKKRLGPTEN